VKGQSGFVAGTFWFDLYNPDQYPDTVRVRDGRFDIPFNWENGKQGFSLKFPHFRIFPDSLSR